MADTAKFAQLDYFVSTTRWENAFRNVEAKHHTGLDSDHYPVVAEVSYKLRKPTEKMRTPAKDMRSTRDQIEYEDTLTQAVETNPALLDPTEATWELLAKTLMEAREANFPDKQEAPRRDYISPGTWDLILQKQKLTKYLNNHPSTEAYAKQLKDL